MRGAVELASTKIRVNAVSPLRKPKCRKRPMRIVRAGSSRFARGLRHCRRPMRRSSLAFSRTCQQGFRAKSSGLQAPSSTSSLTRRCFIRRCPTCMDSADPSPLPSRTLSRRVFSRSDRDLTIVGSMSRSGLPTHRSGIQGDEHRGDVESVAVLASSGDAKRTRGHGASLPPRPLRWEAKRCNPLVVTAPTATSMR